MSNPPRDSRRWPTRRRTAAALLFICAAGLSGCGRQSILTTHSKQAHNIMLLWWWMLAVAAIVFGGAVVMLALAYLRRGVKGLPFLGEREGVAEGMVVLFGIAIPVVVLAALFGVSDVYLIRQTSPPNPKSTAMTIDVIAHQWWWEIRYPGSGAITANEIHIPANTRVNVVATTADVIHSFWVPGLNRKIDTVPGRENRVLLDADAPGTYRGQCSQFCGFQHANMAMVVVAQPKSAFRAWLANMSRPQTSTVSAQVRAGQQLFMTSQCASCHRIAGTSAQGFVGPDLTHVGSRSTLASLTIPNTAAQMTAWIENPQAIKPGDRMPDLGLSRSQAAEITSYLESLR